MGRIIVPKYRLELIEKAINGHTYPAIQSWRGLVSMKRLIKYINSFEKSTMKGGVNSHIGPRKIIQAKIINQKTLEVKEVYNAE